MFLIHLTHKYIYYFTFFIFSKKMIYKKVNKLKGNGNKDNQYILVFFLHVYKTRQTRSLATMTLGNMKKVDKGIWQATNIIELKAKQTNKVTLKTAFDLIT